MSKIIRQCVALFLVFGLTLATSCGQLQTGNTVSDRNTSVIEVSILEDERSEVEIPAIMYHRVLPPEHKGLDKQAITTVQFEEDLKFLLENGFTTVFFQDIINYQETGQKLPEKPIVLTFDDGYYNNYLYAYPLLKKYNMKASLAVIGIRIETADKKQVTDDNYGYCNWQMIKEMSDSGYVEITSHSYSMHQREPRYGLTQMEDESEEEYIKNILADNKKQRRLLSDKIGHEHNVLVCPYMREPTAAAADALIKEGIQLFVVGNIKNQSSVITKKSSYYEKSFLRKNRTADFKFEEFVNSLHALKKDVE